MILALLAAAVQAETADANKPTVKMTGETTSTTITTTTAYRAT
jgi:hypothetical protein